MNDDYFDAWKDWIPTGKINKIFEGLEAAEYGSFPQKFVVGMQGPDGEWSDIGIVAPPEEKLKTAPTAPFPSKDLGPMIHEVDKYVMQLSMWTNGEVWTFDDNPSGMRVIHGIRDVLPGLSERVWCPGTGCDENNTTRISVWSLIQHLNDEHKWTREKIADWLEESGHNPEFPVPEEL